MVCECGRNYGSRHLKIKVILGYKVNTRTYHCLSKYYDWKSGDGSDLYQQEILTDGLLQRICFGLRER